MSKVWLVTGSSRGFGRSLVAAVLARGDRVVATARDPAVLADLTARHGDRVLPFRLDVTDPAQAEAAIAATVERFGGLDVLVNNAGYALMGAVEEMTEAEFRAQIDTNFWGVVHVTRAALPILRRQRRGHIIQFSSVGGRQANPGLSAYQGAKFAVEGFSEALAQEIRPLGIKLTVIEPGGFRTDWAGSSMSFATPIADYEGTVGLLRFYLQTHTGQEPGDPEKAARVLLDLVELPDPPLRLPLGTDALAVLRRSYRDNLAALEAWAATSRSTDFDGVQVSETDHAVLQMKG